MATGNKGRQLPKFGEWDATNPGAAQGFTVIFNNARDDKKTKKTAVAAPESLVTPPTNNEPHQNNNHRHHRHQQNNNHRKKQEMALLPLSPVRALFPKRNDKEADRLSRVVFNK
ncbi:hypothetical protein IGI04_023658 [Brassica rapa subsp. trilocularis]|uniref:RIN4 pathogenic type III effector avirulence factor Avr cleavage site domain-containing protein n=2 Tax=Brassica TaxID=3705 RepID=A0ABQ8D027_BRANA|nr:hypothetical protein IGI04_023658 [Brassica rapa subsp. trilocularis]KAH0922711.1 hypothetical protein HID58_022729 [Brassica napus]